MEIVAHRCRGFGYDEHSIRAIRAALASAVDAIEIDVRLTKDRKWVAIHDPHFKKEERRVRRVHDHTLAQVKREVVSLDTVLALFSALTKKKDLFIDVKDIGETRQLIRLIRRHDLVQRVIVIAWEPEVLKRVHKELPELRLGFSYVPIHERFGKLKGSIERPVSKKGVLYRFNELHSFDRRFPIGKTHQHYLSVLPELPLYCILVFALLCSAKLVQKAHEKGLKIYVFTVNNKLTAGLMNRRNVDGVLTDVPRSFTK